MPRSTPPIRPPDSLFQNILLVDSSTSTGVIHHLLFNDGSINYFDIEVRQNFQYVLIDNIGLGTVRVTYNRPGLDMTTEINGAKTLSSKDALYLEEDIWGIDIYYVMPSTVEIILKSQKE